MLAAPGAGGIKVKVHVSVFSNKDGLSGFDEGQHLFDPIVIESIFCDGEIKEGERVGPGIFDSDCQAEGVSLFSHPTSINQLVNVGDRETGVVTVDLEGIGFGGIKALGLAQVQVSRSRKRTTLSFQTLWTLNCGR